MDWNGKTAPLDIGDRVRILGTPPGLERFRDDVTHVVNIHRKGALRLPLVRDGTGFRFGKPYGIPEDHFVVAIPELAQCGFARNLLWKLPPDFDEVLEGGTDVRQITETA